MIVVVVAVAVVTVVVEQSHIVALFPSPVSCPFPHSPPYCWEWRLMWMLWGELSVFVFFYLCFSDYRTILQFFEGGGLGGRGRRGKRSEIVVFKISVHQKKKKGEKKGKGERGGGKPVCIANICLQFS